MQTVFCSEWDNSPSRQLILWGQILHLVLTCPWGPQDHPLLGALGHQLHPWKQKTVLPDRHWHSVDCQTPCSDADVRIYLLSLDTHVTFEAGESIFSLRWRFTKKIMLISNYLLNQEIYIFASPPRLENKTNSWTFFIIFSVTDSLSMQRSQRLPYETWIGTSSGRNSNYGTWVVLKFSLFYFVQYWHLAVTIKKTPFYFIFIPLLFSP